MSRPTLVRPAASGGHPADADSPIAEPARGPARPREPDGLPLDSVPHPAARRRRRRHRGHPVRKVPAPKRRVDPDRVFADAARRALTAKEAGQLLAWFPLYWWDHVLCLPGNRLRFGEFAGLRLRRVHLDRAIPVLQVVDTRYQAGRFGSGFKPRPESDTGIREVPLASLVVEAIRRQYRPSPTPTPWASPAPAAGTGCHLAHGRPCRATASASTRPPPIGPAPTLRTCSSADHTIFSTASRRGWRTRNPGAGDR